MNKPIHVITEALRKWREDRSYSQADLAKFLTLQMGRSVSRETIRNWETQSRAVTAATALEISKATGIEVTELVRQKEIK